MVVLRGWVAMVLLVGAGACNFDGGVTLLAPDDAGPLISNEPVVQTPLAFEFQPSNFAPHDHQPGGAWTVNCGVVVFDSTTGQFAGSCPGGDTPLVYESNEMVLLAVRRLEVGAGSMLRLRGVRPVALAVYGDALVEGAISASASAEGAGAGGDIDCDFGRGKDGSHPGGSQGGGGGGGAFGSAGGDGASVPSGAGGDGAGPFGSPSLTPLRGGCRGGQGAPSDVQVGGAGGAGGGAVQISLSGVLTVHGTITAGGGGGAGGVQRDGAGGGGSGGGILVEAAKLVLKTSASLTANGGGGGEGGAADGVCVASACAAGESGRATSNQAAPGGSGASGSGGDGGSGSAVAAAQTGSSGATPGGGGGGGGGGAGRIHLRVAGSCSVSTGAVISPAASSSGSAACP